MRAGKFLLLALALVCGLAAASVAAQSTEEYVPSARLQAILALDKQYESALLVEGAARAGAANQSLEAIPKSFAYSAATASKLFWHSVTAYCANNARLKDWSCTSCQKFGSFKVTAVMEKSSNQGYVGYFSGLPGAPMPGTAANQPFALVSFRGSANIGNWIENLSFSKKAAFSPSYPKVNVHSGFWGAYQNLKAAMLPGLRTAIKNSGAKAIIFTGHSLGCAIAQLAALDTKLSAEFKGYGVAVYGQGCPRVGDAEFATLYQKTIDLTFREVRQADIVAHLPPLLLGFKHSVTEIFYNSAMSSYAYCNSVWPVGEDPRCSNAIPAPISVSDHTSYRGIGMGSYCGTYKAENEMEESEAAELAPEDLIDVVLRDVAAQQAAGEMPTTDEAMLEENNEVAAAVLLESPAVVAEAQAEVAEVQAEAPVAEAELEVKAAVEPEAPVAVPEAQSAKRRPLRKIILAEV